MLSSPAIAILIGTLAGFFSAFGITHGNPYFIKKLKLHDTCGVHFIHGIPAIIGWISSSIIAAATNPNDLLNTFEH
jgi:ammonium transporter Rh